MSGADQNKDDEEKRRTRLAAWKREIVEAKLVIERAGLAVMASKIRNFEPKRRSINLVFKVHWNANSLWPEPDIRDYWPPKTDEDIE